MESNCTSIHDDRSGVSWHDLSKSDYAKVIFCDLYYLHNNKVGCRFQITDNVHEDPCDYIGLFRVGYDNISQCLIFKLLSETRCEEDGKRLCCEFKWNELPKLEHGFYQFVYITCDKEICGASTPFEIRDSDAKNDSSDEDIVAENVEDDYILVKSNAKEKVTLLLRLLDEYRVRNLNLSSELEKCIKEKEKLVEEYEENFANMRKEIVNSQDVRRVEKLKAEEKLKVVKQQLAQDYALADKKQKAYLKALEDSAIAKDQEKVELEAQLKEITEELRSANLSKKELSDKCKYLEELAMQQNFEKELKEKEALIEKFGNELARNNFLIQKFEHELADNKVLIEKFEKKLEEKDALVVKFENEIAEKTILVTKFEKELAEKNAVIEKHEGEINSLEKELDEKVVLIHKLKREISALHGSIKNSSEDQVNKVCREALQTNAESSNISGEEPTLSLDVKSYCEKNKKKSAVELKCENLSLTLKLLEKTTALSEEKKSYSILKNEYQNLKSELEKEVISLNKVLNSLDEHEIENLRLKEELEKETVTCAELKQLLNEKDCEITALKLMLDVTSKQMKSDFEKEVAEKEAVIKKLSMENSQLQDMRNQSESNYRKNEASLHAALAESVSRLKEAEELYKKQFLEISKLKRKFKNKCGKKQKEALSESCSQASESFSSLEVKASEIFPGGSVTKKVPSDKNSSDSDTGERVLGSTVPLYPQFENIFPKTEHVEQQLQPNISCKPSNQISIVNESGACPSMETTEKDIVIQQMAASSACHNAFEQCVRRPSDAVEDEIFYSVPCVVCEVPIKVSSTFNENMVKHLEKVHQQQMCPICGRLYSMGLPQKYFLYHVDDHFAN